MKHSTVTNFPNTIYNEVTQTGSALLPISHCPSCVLVSHTAQSQKADEGKTVFNTTIYFPQLLDNEGSFEVALYGARV